MSTLLVKELRQLLPFAALWLALSALFYGSELFTTRVDEESYASWCGELCRVGIGTDLLVFELLFYLVAVYGLFTREFDDYTIDFLRSLPISRSAVFFAKIGAAWLMLGCLILLDHLLSAALLSLNSQTLTGRFYWQVDMQLMLRSWLLAIIVTAHGVFLSAFRTVGLLVYAAYLLVLIWLENARGVSGIYNLFEVYRNEYFGQELLLNWPAIFFHLAVAAVLLFISYFIWTRRDSHPGKAEPGAWAKIWPAALSVVAFLFVASIMLAVSQRNAGQFADSERATSQSRFYHFVYKTSDAEAAQALAGFADDDYEALVSLLGVDEKPFIHADLTSESGHLLGQAAWKKINMVLADARSVNPLSRRVLSHETAHVFQSVVAKRKLREVANATGFFIEGMAQYTSFAIVDDDESRRSNWLLAAAAWDRQDIRFAHMTDRRGFDSLYDPELYYSIGDVWVASMVDVCGRSAMGDFLRSAGNKSLAPGTSGVRYWQLMLQDQGCELAEVNAHWHSTMKQVLAGSHAPASTFASFDNIAIGQGSDENSVRLSADVRPDPGYALPSRFYIRIEAKTSLARTANSTFGVMPKQAGDTQTVEFDIPKRLLGGSRFRYQLGYHISPDSRVYYDRWQSGYVPEQ